MWRRSDVTALVAILAIVGCARRLPPHATALDAERSNVALAELEQGRSLVVSRCGSRCHKPPLPADHVSADWPRAINEMGPRANLTPHEHHLIEQYMLAMTPH